MWDKFIKMLTSKRKRFKVGDKVKVIGNTAGFSHYAPIGTIGAVSSVHYGIVPSVTVEYISEKTGRTSFQIISSKDLRKIN